MFNVTNIAASGLAAERLRLEVAANNLANAQTTRGHDGEPYRRQQVIFAAAVDGAMGNSQLTGMRGVTVEGIHRDEKPFLEVFQPGHPDADADGMVRMPNVSVAHEMVDLTTASRSYEANLRVLKTYRQLVEETLALLRG